MYCDVLSLLHFLYSHSSHPRDQPTTKTTKQQKKQGFVFYASQIASMFLSAFFAIQLVLHVRYGWPEARLKRIERIFLILGLQWQPFWYLKVS
jgi:hypothetical protein